MKLVNTFIYLSITITAFNCSNQPKNNFPAVFANKETEPVISGIGDDAADDPAIWVNPSNPEISYIIGTDKKKGLAVYNLDGKIVSFNPVGRVNNVDIQDDFEFGNNKFPLVGASNRSDSSLTFLQLKDNGELLEIPQQKIKCDIGDVYGFCFYHNIKTNITYAFVSGKGGKVEQWELKVIEGELIPKLVRVLSLPSQIEGMVADAENEVIYIAEEDFGIWRYDANIDGTNQPEKIKNTSPSENKNIVDDIEGLSMYFQPNGKGYLIASSQGNDSYAIFNREYPNNYIGSFAIKDSIVDGVQETDGIHVTSSPVGNSYPQGLLIVQDGFNYDGETKTSQNFKIVDWRMIQKTMKIR